MRIQLYKMVNGEEVIARLVSAEADRYQLNKPMLVSYHQTERGVAAALSTYIPVGEDEVSLMMHAVAATCEPSSEFAKQYQEHSSGLVLP